MRKLSPMALAALFSACSSSPNPGSDGPGFGQTKSYLCKKDPKLLEEPIDCAADADCPCGSACDLGRCGFSCAEDIDCPMGLVCDVFGACSETVEGNPVSPPVSEDAGQLAVDPVGLSLRPARPEGVFAVGSRGGPMSAVRVLAPAQVEVSCDGGATYGPDCRHTALLSNDGPRATRVRVTAPPPTSGVEAFEVRVVSATGRTSVEIRYGADRPEDEIQPLPGQYRGTARVFAAGLDGLPEVAPVPDALRSLAIPVQATVYATETQQRAVHLRDGLGALFGRDGAVGGLQGPEDALLLSLPAAPYVQDDDRIQISVTAAGAMDRGTSGLGGRLRLEFLGVTESDRIPFVELELALARTDDLPAEAAAPPVPAPRLPTVFGRREQPLVPEVVTGQLVGSVGALEPGAPTDVLARLCTPLSARPGDPAGTWGSAILSTWSEEPACTDPTVTPVAFAAFTGWSLETQLERCASDAAHARASLSGASAELSERECFDGSRLAGALASALSGARERAAGLPTPPRATSETLAHRLAQQWIEAHTFVANQVRQTERLNRLLGQAERIAWPEPPTSILHRSVEGWDLLLHPRIAAGLAYLSPLVFQAPDPRPRVAGVSVGPTQPHHTFERGLPVSVARALQLQLAAVRDRLERDRFMADGRDVLEDLATSLARRSVLVYALARGLFDSARAQSPGDLAWQSDWEASELAFGGALGGLARGLFDFRKQTNPLGLDDQLDLPLYRIGSQVGAQARFSAVSEYLLGTPGAAIATAWVPSQLAEAERAHAGARLAVQDNLQRDFAADLEGAARYRRIEGIRRRYGEGIVSLCGNPEWDAFSVLDEGQSIDPDTCFLAPGCESDLSDVVERLDPGDLAYRLCLYGRAQTRRGSGATESNPLIRELPAEVIERIVSGEATVVDVEALNGELVVTLSDNSSVRMSSASWQAVERLFLDATFTPDAFAADHAACDAVRQQSLVDRPALPPERCFDDQSCPVGYVCQRPSDSCVPVPDQDARNPQCFRGGLGELVLGLRASAREVDIARSELKEYGESYDRAMRSCIITQVGNDRRESVLAEHNDTVRDFAVGKLAADVTANMAAAVKDTAAAASENPYASVTAGIAAGVEAAAKSTSDGLQFAIEDLQRRHAETMLSIDNEIEERVCFNDAELHLVGVRTAGLRIEQATLDLARQLVELENQKVALRSMVREGLDALRRERERRVAPTEMDFWLDDRVEQLDAALRRAKRALYLATLAVEYELQLSFGRKDEILSALRPSTLRDIYQTLQALRGTGAVDGAQPGNRVAVVSLRRNLLQLADRSTFPDGWHEMTDAQRFRAFLTSPENAVYDESGRYLGQEIRFTISPLAALGLGESQGVPLLTAVDCAERLWSVNAALAGLELSAIPDSTVTDVVLRKRNTFYSQWCGDGGTTDMQVASTRPNRNLFLDPYSSFAASSQNLGVPQPDRGAIDTTRAFTSARVRAFFGVPRGELERDDYFNGESTELAGRGLYGDYALFFPVETLSIDGSDGLRLENVEDVLLRLDYVSVASR
jgi:hypothetical protein